ncbi:Lysosome-associated membrane glycoprotein 5 [Orchesella cincta]|uniref:Lysosome-associated membrane glycoprotein 5 n=1 Tax=Orchesella cincta TaxID=48709 RepID=A0A1D2NAB2_ORCCI|nr:Lysosome-associated membrane glycoprotein 5 [Orchesella cincta]
MYRLQGNVSLFKALIFSYFVVQVACEIDLGQQDYTVDEVRWGLTDTNKTNTCIILNGIIQIIVPYNTANSMTGLTLLNVPKNATVFGSCGRFTENMTLSWFPKSGVEEDDPPTNQHKIELIFKKKGETIGDPNGITTEPFYELESVNAVFYAGETEFPNFSHDKPEYTFRASNLGMLSAPVDLSYFCQSTQVVNSETDETTLVLSYLQAQAFHQGLSDTGPDGVDFGPRSYCPKDGYQMIFTVVGCVMMMTLLGAAIFIILSRKNREGYAYL